MKDNHKHGCDINFVHQQHDETTLLAFAYQMHVYTIFYTLFGHSIAVIDTHNYQFTCTIISLR